MENLQQSLNAVVLQLLQNQVTAKSVEAKCMDRMFEAHSIVVKASVEMAQNLASQDRKVPLMKPPRDPAGCAGIGGALPALPASGSAIGLAVGGVQSPRCTMWKRCESELDRHTHVGWTDVKEGVPSLRTRTWPDTPNVSISIGTSNTAQVRVSSRVA
ncbi:unnamed protein product [Effrenium voratum]|nr:unnamed protein product [Effrenium voratum]